MLPPSPHPPHPHLTTPGKQPPTRRTIETAPIGAHTRARARANASKEGSSGWPKYVQASSTCVQQYARLAFSFLEPWQSSYPSALRSHSIALYSAGHARDSWARSRVCLSRRRTSVACGVDFGRTTAARSSQGHRKLALSHNAPTVGKTFEKTEQEEVVGQVLVQIDALELPRHTSDNDRE